LEKADPTLIAQDKLAMKKMHKMRKSQRIVLIAGCAAAGGFWAGFGAATGLSPVLVGLLSALSGAILIAVSMMIFRGVGE
jgi:hypothetical protein